MKVLTTCGGEGLSLAELHTGVAGRVVGKGRYESFEPGKEWMESDGRDTVVVYVPVLYVSVRKHTRFISS